MKSADAALRNPATFSSTATTVPAPASRQIFSDDSAKRQPQLFSGGKIELYIEKLHEIDRKEK
jgi:hypothetical protein